MEFKIDENVHPAVIDLLAGQGHTGDTVWDENLRGCDDNALATECRKGSRVLITLDLDFSDLRAYPPERYPGIVVLRLDQQSREAILAAVGRLLELLEHEPVAGRLWIVDEATIRIRRSDQAS